MSDLFLGEFSTDLTPPEVTNPYPAPPDYAFPRDYVVEFDITDTETGVDMASLDVSLDGVPAIVGGVFQGPDYGGTISGPVDGTYHVEITTHPDFDSYASVEVTVDAQDLAPIPNVMSQYVWSFDTEDYEPPYVEPGYAPTGTDVAVTALVTFTVKDDGAGVDLSTLQVTIGGVDAIVDGAFVSPFDGAGSEIVDTLAPAEYGVAIDADPDYAEWTTYEVIVNAYDLAVAGPVIAARFDDGILAYEGFETAPSNLDILFDIETAIVADFDDGVAETEEFEFAPSNRDEGFDAGTAVAATFNDDVDSVEEFENWD